MDWLLNLDTQISMAVNGAHSPFWDTIMIFVSKTYVWVPLYLAVLIWLIIKYKSSWRAVLTAVLCIILTFGLTDQISSYIKDVVCRYRPCHEPSLEGIVRVIVSKGGKYGFFSSHAANVCGFAFLTSKLLEKKWFGFCIWCWAAIICYSRIYLAKHYFGDVLCGVIFGILLAAVIWYFCRKMIARFNEMEASY